MKQNIKTLHFNDREIILVGTAHISKESMEEVDKTVRDTLPDCVAVELDEQRYESIKSPEAWKTSTS